MNQAAENPATVLIVNDNQVQLDLLRDLLEAEAYKIFVADNSRSRVRSAWTSSSLM